MLGRVFGLADGQPRLLSGQFGFAVSKPGFARRQVLRLSVEFRNSLGKFRIAGVAGGCSLGQFLLAKGKFLGPFRQPEPVGTRVAIAFGQLAVQLSFASIEVVEPVTQVRGQLLGLQPQLGKVVRNRGVGRRKLAGNWRGNWRRLDERPRSKHVRTIYPGLQNGDPRRFRSGAVPLVRTRVRHGPTGLPWRGLRIEK